MKKIFIFSALLLMMLLLSSTEIFSQFIVRKVHDQNVNTSQDGFFYALPQTVLKIDLLIEKIQQQKGPLSEYTQEYLGTSEFIENNSTSYRLLNVLVDQFAEPDPEQIYYVQFPTTRPKDAKAIGFELTPLGTLIAFDIENTQETIHSQSEVNQTIIVSDQEDGFNYFAEYNRKQKVDTIIRKITIDTVTIDRFLFKTSWVDKSLKEKANEAAMQIAKIRESRFNLITGYQEVNYGESMKYMNQQLNLLEKEYLTLFLGKELKTIETQTVYFIPSKENNSKVLYSGSDGSSIKLKLTNNGITDKLPAKPLEKQDNIYYRIPESTLVEITENGSIHYKRKMPISQYGVVAAAPLNGTRLQFDPKTGSLIKIIRE
jgi:hypothetical protein